MNIHSTDNERYSELKNISFTITQDSSSSNVHFGKYFNQKGQELLWKDTYHYIKKELNIDNKKFYLNQSPYQVLLNQKTIKESIASTNKTKGDLFILSKVFSNIQEICNNSVLIDIEEYKYPWKLKSKSIEAEYYFISALELEFKVYPILLIVEDKIKKDEVNFHLIISGKKLEGDFLKTGVHEYNSESQPAQVSSPSKIMVSQFANACNKNHRIILKHFPNQMLTEKQIHIKKEALAFDNKRIEYIHQRDKQREKNKKT